MAAVPHKALPVYALYLLLAIWFQGADAHSTTREPMQALLALRPDLASVAVELNRTAARGVSVHVLHQSSDGLRAIRLPEGQSAAEVDPAEIESPASTDVSFGWAGSSEVFMHGSSSGTSRELRADAPGTFCFITTVSQLDADDRGCSLHVGLVVGKAGNRWIMDYEGGTHIGWYNDMSCGARCFWNTSVTPPDYAVLGERSSGHQAGLPESRSLPTLVAAKGIKDGLCHWRNEQVVGTAGYFWNLHSDGSYQCFGRLIRGISSKYAINAPNGKWVSDGRGSQALKTPYKQTSMCLLNAISNLDDSNSGCAVYQKQVAGSTDWWWFASAYNDHDSYSCGIQCFG